MSKPRTFRIEFTLAELDQLKGALNEAAIFFFRAETSDLWTRLHEAHKAAKIEADKDAAQLKDMLDAHREVA